jgi:S-DNA-T family DNA segregation ATPase FtsK/SpoIIIE
MSKRRPSSSRKKSQKALVKDLPSLNAGGLLDEALAVSFCALALFLCVSFLSFEAGRGDGGGPSANVLGPVGHFTGTMLSGFLGWCALVPVAWALASAVFWWRFDERRAKGKDEAPLGLRGVLVGIVGLGCVVVAAATLGAVFFGPNGGGRVGQLFAVPLVRLVNRAGATIIVGAFLLFALSILTRRSVFDVVLNIGGGLKVGGRFFGFTVPTFLLRGLARVSDSVGNGVRGLSARVAEARDDEPHDDESGTTESRGKRGRARDEGTDPTTARGRNAAGGGEAGEPKRSRGKDRAAAPEVSTGDDIRAEESVVAGSRGELDDEEPPRDYSHVVVKRRDNSDKKLEVRKVRKIDPPEVAAVEPQNLVPYELPDVALLTRGEPSVGSENDEELRDKSRQIESKLRDFGINGQVTQVHPGPVITLFEFEPAPGVKVGKIAALQDDLAMSLRASSIRIIAPIPKRGTVGIEVPNKHRDIVRLRDCLESEAFVTADSTLSVAIGKDTYGDPVIVDIASMPHLLMAGATGTGKSVCINTLLLSLLYRATPEELGLILIDPKILELSIYEDIPHLRVPVVTVPRQAKAVLEWAVNEMNRRYRLMQKFGVRNIDGYNRVVRGEESPTGELETNVIELKEDEVVESGIVEKPAETAAVEEEGKAEFVEKLEPLPKIVIVIDELADLMLTVGRDIEELITRLAQKARASGIHLILATQRPSVDVITGLIKANFPARLSFRVSSRIDSRTILDSMGAEKLLGRGDMLFMAPGAEALKRVHGAFVSDSEVKRVMDALKARHKPRYDERIIAMCDKALQEESENGQTKDLLLDEDEYDAIYDRALELVMEKGQASTSMLQRAFRIGYNRAARIIDLMEREGVVGPMDGAKPRDVIVPRDEQVDS